MVVSAAAGGMCACVAEWLQYAIWNSSYSMSLLQMHPWPMALMCVCCVVLAWGLRHVLASEARMGLAPRAATLVVVMVGLMMTAFGVKRGLEILFTPFACCVVVLWSACYLCSRADWRQSLKSAWRVGCIIMTWLHSVACWILTLYLVVLTVTDMGCDGSSEGTHSMYLIERSAYWAALTYFLALLFYLAGGARAHSPLVFCRPRMNGIFLALLVALCVGLAILEPQFYLGTTKIWLELSVVGAFINIRVQRSRRWR